MRSCGSSGISPISSSGSYDEMFVDAEVFMRGIMRTARSKDEIVAEICKVYAGMRSTCAAITTRRATSSRPRSISATLRETEPRNRRRTAGEATDSCSGVISPRIMHGSRAGLRDSTGNFWHVSIFHFLCLLPNSIFCAILSLAGRRRVKIRYENHSQPQGWQV